LKKRLIELAVVATLLLLASMVIWLVDADRILASAVLGPEKINPIGNKFWPAGSANPWAFLYHWGPVPSFVLAGAALVALAAGFFVRRLAGCRKKAVFLLLFMALGPGLVINVLLKDQLGRPRPREVVEYGGTHAYIPFWEFGDAGSNSSFPSGHAAIAFFMIAPWFVLRDEKPLLARAFLAFGLGWGIMVSIARILQGGHFLSDVVWSAGLVYLIGGALALALGFYRDSDASSG
jgi:membrane-associated PAP2 superfamily phosphatase